MYKVEVYHYREAIVKGDLEDEQVLIQSELFKTRKSAKEWIEGKVRGKSSVSRSYHKGNTKSYVWYNTGHKWRHENSGEMCYECYTYILEKAKVR
jgi:hypothetical protein